MDLKGNAYAKVATRIKEFREIFLNGLIECEHKLEADGSWTFKAHILKDKAVPTSGESTGSSRGYLNDPKTKVELPKAFEKLETIAVGRALANIGFMASGDVASFEEMEDFLSAKETKRQEKIQEVIEAVDAITDLATLREFYKENKGYGVEVDQYIMQKSATLKANAKNTP